MACNTCRNVVCHSVNNNKFNHLHSTIVSISTSVGFSVLSFINSCDLQNQNVTLFNTNPTYFFVIFASIANWLIKFSGCTLRSKFRLNIKVCKSIKMSKLCQRPSRSVRTRKTVVIRIWLDCWRSHVQVVQVSVCFDHLALHARVRSNRWVNQS